MHEERNPLGCVDRRKTREARIVASGPLRARPHVLICGIVDAAGERSSRHGRRERTTGAVYAMKKLDKEAMVERGHVQHVRAEVDVMSEAVMSEWVV